MQLTFTKVFKAEGNKNGKPWIRWDYKTADEQRFVHFAGSQEIPLNTVVEIETSPSGSISDWKAIGSTTSEVAPQGVRSDSVASGGDSERQTRIHRQTAAKVAARLLDFFPEDEQSLETFFLVSEQLVAYFESGVTETVPF